MTMLKIIVSFVLLFILFTQQALANSTGANASQEATPSGRSGSATTTAPVVTAKSEFARMIERLSEPGGFFDTDNLISNEASYLHVLGAMQRMNISGGAYIGVGPDQNFSYIAQIRPRIAFIIDIRRDNLLQHFLFKALFALSRNRAEYLCLLFGRPLPEDIKQWNGRSIQQLIEYIDKTPLKPAIFEMARASVQAKTKGFGLPLTAEDLEVINRIHHSFSSAGLDLRFTSFNRPPRSFYPSFRDLLLEKDLSGRQANYLVHEESFQFIKSLEDRNLIIPVVGNLAGPHALAAIGEIIAKRGERVSAFYTSNVEFYLMQEGTFDRFVENVRALPRAERSLIIRSYFNGSVGYSHPQSVPGYYSTQLLQTMESLVKEQASGGYQSYADLINKHVLDSR